MAIIVNNNNDNLNISSHKRTSNGTLNRTSKRSATSTPLIDREKSNLFAISTLSLPVIFEQKNFNKPGFEAIKSNGLQSKIMVGFIDGEKYYFKKILDKHSANTRRNLEKECVVFAYLRELDNNFLKYWTCYSNCYKDGILLKDGGSSLYQMLKNRTFRFNFDIFKQFFFKLKELHKLLITHNDLHCGNSVGWNLNDIRFIDFGLATIHSSAVLDLDFLQKINIAFSGIFFALCIKYQINSV